MFGYVGPYQEEVKGRAVSLEFALFTTVIVMLLGGAAFLVSTFTVEVDRKVSYLTAALIIITDAF